MNGESGTSYKRLLTSKCYYSGLWVLVAAAWFERLDLQSETSSLHAVLQEILTRSSDLGRYWADQVLNVPSDRMVTSTDVTGVFTPSLFCTTGVDRIHDYLNLFIQDSTIIDEFDFNFGLNSPVCPIVESMVEIVLGGEARKLFLTLIERKKDGTWKFQNTRQGVINPRDFEGELRHVVSNHPIMKLQARFDVVKYLIVFFSQALQFWIIEDEDPIKAAREWLESML